MEKAELIRYGKFGTTYGTLTGIGTRVIARDGPEPNAQFVTVARDAQTAPTVFSLYGHLMVWKSFGFRTPWLSVSRSWAATLRSVERLKNAGAKDIYIVLFEMETAGPAIDAASFAHAYGIMEWRKYQHEWLYCGFVPK